MNFLALDTCSERCSIAVQYEGALFHNSLITQRGHSDVLLSMIDDVLAEANCELGDIDMLAFGRGPGSFTGVRVGVSVAQGIAYARELPVVPVSSLAAIAQQAGKQLGQGDYAVAMDARMGEIYCAHYHYDGELAHLVDKERVCQPTDFTIAADRPVIGVGSAWAIYSDELQHQFGAQLLAWHSAFYSDASMMLTLAIAEVKAGRAVSAEQAIPVYLRDNVAKKKGERHGK